MRSTLLILAAGIGSRFGSGIKQLEPVGLNNAIMIDYSIHDAIEAGFNRIVFVIRRDIEDVFRAMIGNRIEENCTRLGVEVAYAYQSIDAIPEGASVPLGRTKPWGTGQAVLAAKELICEPFAVINADDYYGKEAFRSIHEFLTHSNEPNAYCMAGFVLKNTLSDNGGVTRGVCQVKDRLLQNVTETSNIVKTESGVAADGEEIDPNAYVSMNMWGLTPSFIDALETGFKEFFCTTVREDPLRAEYLLPNIIGSMLRDGSCTVRLLPTNDSWFGITYKEDRDMVVESFKQLIDTGVYRAELYSDISEK